MSDESTREDGPATVGGILLYLLLGTLFSFILTRGEVISWFRIQEMFRFQSFHMFGVFAGALAVAIPSLRILRTGKIRTVSGGPITVPPKEGTPLQIRYWGGGALFGVGWALTGACPGPLFALLGAGLPIILVPISFALLGTWLYGALRTRLPH